MSEKKHQTQLTLVLPKPNQCLLNTLGAKLARIDGYRPMKATALSPGKVLDISLQAPIDRLAITRALSSHKVDFCLSGSKHRRKKLLICDMDSTLIGQECIDELAGFAGVGAYVAEITERAMRGELDFEAALDERVGLLKGLPLSELERCFAERIRLNPGAKTLAATMRKAGAKTVIVSGGFTFFTARVAKQAGFASHFANTLLDDGQTLTGKVARPILGREAKLQTLLRESAQVGGPDMAVAIGDGANDLAMIQRAGLGIAYHAKPIVAKAAHCAINHTDLTTALYFQGFCDDEFVR